MKASLCGIMCCWASRLILRTTQGRIEGGKEKGREGRRGRKGGRAEGRKGGRAGVRAGELAVGQTGLHIRNSLAKT